MLSLFVCGLCVNGVKSDDDGKQNERTHKEEQNDVFLREKQTRERERERNFDQTNVHPKEE